MNSILIMSKIKDFFNSIRHRYTEDNLITLRDYYRSNMELSWIITAAWYIVQIIDANVDAHFFYYDINDDLTLHFEPQFNTATFDKSLINGNNIGLSLILNFKF